jgi:hypothetical protein
MRDRVGCSACASSLASWLVRVHILHGRADGLRAVHCLAVHCHDTERPGLHRQGKAARQNHEAGPMGLAGCSLRGRECALDTIQVDSRCRQGGKHTRGVPSDQFWTQVPCVLAADCILGCNPLVTPSAVARARYWQQHPDDVWPFRPSQFIPGFCILKPFDFKSKLLLKTKGNT